MPPLTAADRLAGGLVGLLVGDALGVPFEFRPAIELPPAAALDFATPPGFDRSHPGTPPGTWSDDGAQALCLLASLLDGQALDLADFAQRLLDWRWQGRWAVDGRVFDVGAQTQRALAALVQGTPPDRAGGTGAYDNGNGSLMRVLPLALWHTGEDAALARDAARQSLPTHGHPRAQVACALYCLWARAELAGVAHGWDAAAARLRALAPTLGFPAIEVERVLDPGLALLATGAGYVLDTLYVAKNAMSQATDYASAVRTAIAVGNDTDTTAAVTGGIAGLRYGLGAIPESWRTGLRGQDLLRPLLHALLVRAGAADPWPLGLPPMPTIATPVGGWARLWQTVRSITRR